MVNVDILKYEIEADRYLTENSSMLCGFSSDRYPDFVKIKEQTKICNEISYAYYPLIQYTVFKGKLNIIGINQGIKIIKNLYSNISSFKLGKELYKVKNCNTSRFNSEFGISDHPIGYLTKTPYITLNKKRTAKYLSNENLQNKILCDSIYGNISSMSKALNYNGSKDINVAVTACEEEYIHINGTIKLAFDCIFMTNFIIPDDICIGKYTYNGFGSIKSTDIDNYMIEELTRQLSSPEVLERGERFNREFNNFSVEELYRPMTI